MGISGIFAKYLPVLLNIYLVVVNKIDIAYYNVIKYIMDFFRF